MFHEIFLAPFKQTKKFRSPDVALLPFVGGSTHAVMTPLWMPGLWVVLLAPAIAVTAANETTMATARSFVDGATITSSFLVSSGSGGSAPRAFSEARREVAQSARFTAIDG
jgi:hypothetical protein